MKYSFNIIICLMGMSLFFSCEEQESLTPIEASVNTDDPLVQHIISLGIAPENIQEYEDAYIAESDIRFSKDIVLPGEGVQLEHNATINKVGVSNRSIKVYINQNSFTLSQEDIIHGRVYIQPYVLTQSLNAAMAAYNSLNTSIQFQLASNNLSTNTITIKKPDLGFSAPSGLDPYGRADFPSNNKAGKTIDIFPVSINNNISVLTKVLVHELGHTIGLFHTDIQFPQSFGAEKIPGTPTTDSESVMNSWWPNQNWAGFSDGDIQAVNCLYSNNPNSQCISTGPEVCTRPNTPSGITINSGNQDYFYASISGITNADGYEWLVSGGLIASGSGTSQIKIIPHRFCMSPRTVSISVKAYNTTSTETCYSLNTASASHQHQSNCGLLF